jgi:hypothetical protein
LESIGLLMQQHNTDDFIHDKNEKRNKSEREEVVPRYRSISPPFYREDHEKERV